MISASTIKRLFEAGLSAEQIAIVSEEIERACNEVQREAVAKPLHSIERRPMTSTERSRLFREKRKGGEGDGRQRNATKSAAKPLHVSPTPPSLSVEILTSKEVLKQEKEVVTREGGVDDVVSLWNRFADYANSQNLCAPGCRISRVVRMTASRQSSAKQRLSTYGLEQMKKSLNIARQTPGLLGHNERQWRANIDWFLRPNTVTSILEGKYDNWKPPRSAMASAFDGLQGKIGEHSGPRDGAGGPEPPDDSGLSY